MNIYKIENLSFRYQKNQNYILKNIYQKDNKKHFQSKGKKALNYHYLTF